MLKKLKDIKVKEIFTKDNFRRFFGKMLRSFKKYFSTNVLFLTYVFTSMLIGLLLRYFTLGDISEFKALLCDFTIAILLGSFGYLIKPKHQFKYFFTLSIFYTFLCIINHIYYTFFMSFVSVSLLATISMVGEVSDSVTSKLELVYFIYLLAPIIMFIVNRVLSKKNYYFEVGKHEKSKRMFIKTGVTGIVIVFFVLITLVPSEASRLVKQWNRDYIVQRFGLYVYTFNDLIQSIQPSISTMFGYDSAAKTFREFYSNKEDSIEKNEFTNIFEGKNVIFIHAESIQNYLIDLEVNGMEITPNLNKLAKEGMYFSSFYPQISVGTSSDTEFTLSTGLLPSSSGTVFVNFYNREYESIQSLFKEKGYYTFSMHANNADYWNRKTMYKTLGYNRFYSKDDYEVPKDKEDPDYIGLGLSDKSFLHQSISYLNDIKANNKNYMGTIITLSNHSPFDAVDKYGEIDFSITFDKGTGEYDSNGIEIKETVTVPYLEDTEMGNYLKSAHYADEALGEFFKEVKENGLDENTVFIIYGDHESKLGRKNLNLLYNYDVQTEGIKDPLDPTYVSLENYQYDLIKNTPFIIWTSDTAFSKEVTDVMGMWDVLPTVGNMFGFTPTYALGNDVFSNKEKIVVFPNGNVLTNKIYYSNLNDEYISFTEEPIDFTYLERLKSYADERLEVSKSIIFHDMIKNETSNIERMKENEKGN